MLVKKIVYFVGYIIIFTRYSTHTLSLTIVMTIIGNNNRYRFVIISNNGRYSMLNDNNKYLFIPIIFDNTEPGV